MFGIHHLHSGVNQQQPKKRTPLNRSEKKNRKSRAPLYCGLNAQSVTQPYKTPAPAAGSRFAQIQFALLAYQFCWGAMLKIILLSGILAGKLAASSSQSLPTSAVSPEPTSPYEYERETRNDNVHIFGTRHYHRRLFANYSTYECVVCVLVYGCSGVSKYVYFPKFGLLYSKCHTICRRANQQIRCGSHRIPPWRGMTVMMKMFDASRRRFLHWHRQGNQIVPSA